MDVSIVIPFLNEEPNGFRDQMPQIKVVSFRRNFGQTAAMVAGLDYAQGEIVVTLDADRQNDPADIPNMVAKIEEGYDMACGWRHDRQDTFVSRKLPSMMANRLISKMFYSSSSEWCWRKNC